jgi:hypothetical protein
MNYEIPTSFMLAGHRWRVKQCKLNGLYGDCDCDKHVIRIATHIDDVSTTDEQRFATFLHEFVHAALHTLGMDDSEQLAAGLEQMYFQLHKTARWKRTK